MKIEFSKKIIQELINTVTDSTPGLEATEIKTLEYQETGIEINLLVKVNEEIKKSKSVIGDFKKLLIQNLKSIFDEPNITLEITRKE